MLQNLTGWHALIVLAIVFLLFGATKLPALAKSVGQSVRILKSEVEETADPAPTMTTPAVSSVPEAAPAESQTSHQNGYVS
ncbi:twin-arginine translocase TatA/TatE family subunit [Nesterenkonia muleiensis]|uniref:twin-arginine translocase TatA/TatE family subunit n=1 Tax=Nesterenkonia muleiensis TaxID=2282648 RepID=UPI000E760682|nr:twin-arginine translocase TatA/TatE family subunit [Nesterenkonia muleiensis]